MELLKTLHDFLAGPDVPNPAPDKAGVWGNEWSWLTNETKNNPQPPDYGNLGGDRTEWSWLVDMFADKPGETKPNPLGMINGAMPIRKRGPGATPAIYQAPPAGVRG